MAYLDDEEPAESETSSEADTAASATAEKGDLFDDQVAASTEEDD
jgi:hypothetical protein